MHSHILGQSTLNPMEFPTLLKQLKKFSVTFSALSLHTINHLFRDCVLKIFQVRISLDQSAADAGWHWEKIIIVKALKTCIQKATEWRQCEDDPRVVRELFSTVCYSQTRNTDVNTSTEHMCFLGVEASEHHPKSATPWLLVLGQVSRFTSWASTVCKERCLVRRSLGSLPALRIADLYYECSGKQAVQFGVFALDGSNRKCWSLILQVIILKLTNPKGS